MFRILCASLIVFSSLLSAEPVAVQGRVMEALADSREYRIELDAPSAKLLEMEASQVFRVGLGDAELDYTGRTIRADAVFYNKLW
ncbi:MAG: hypothetical protein ABF315_01725, partial [Lentimonas sp.]